MSVNHINWKNEAVTCSGADDWQEAKGHRFHILLMKEDDGTFSAIALNLPGVGSCGSTEEEAIENFKEAARGVLEAYESSKEEIPWKVALSEDIPFEAKQKWIIVNA